MAAQRLRCASSLRWAGQRAAPASGVHSVAAAPHMPCMLPLCAGGHTPRRLTECGSPPPLQEHSLFEYNEQMTWRKLGRLLLIPTNAMAILQARALPFPPPPCLHYSRCLKGLADVWTAPECCLSVHARKPSLPPCSCCPASACTTHPVGVAPALGVGARVGPPDI